LTAVSPPSFSLRSPSAWYSHLQVLSSSSYLHLRLFAILTFIFYYLPIPTVRRFACIGNQCIATAAVVSTSMDMGTAIDARVEFT